MSLMVPICCIDCREGDVRLAGGISSSLQGRVEVCYDKVWGTVCVSSWSSKDAEVVCRQLGYETLGKMTLLA